MKRQFTVLILIICAKFSFGQTHAVKVDSIVKEKIAKLSLAKQNNYHNLISKRQETGFYERLDTIKCDYVYIEERFNILDSTITTFEYYFNAIQKVFIKIMANIAILFQILYTITASKLTKDILITQNQ